MRAPRSYTAEDVIELHCHGGGVCAERVLRATIEAGARPAKPGEFTLRAFLNGRLGLSQVWRDAGLGARGCLLRRLTRLFLWVNVRVAVGLVCGCSGSFAGASVQQCTTTPHTNQVLACWLNIRSDLRQQGSSPATGEG